MATKAKKLATAKKSSKTVKKTTPAKTKIKAKKKHSATPARSKLKKKVTASKAKPALKKAKAKSSTKKITASKKKLSKPLKKKLIAAKVTVAKKATPVAIANKGKAKAIKPKKTKTIEKISKLIPNMTNHLSAVTPEEILPYEEKTGEEYMNKKQQEHFKMLLLQRKKEFMDEMERTVHHLQDEAANFPDPNDRATQEEEFGLVLRTRDRELKYIKNIEDALQRIEEGEYGYCEACGVEIGIRRLEARPTATLCIDCKTLDEIREKQMGG